MARPRSISDQTILQEAYELLMEVGPNGFTFERLGTQVGLVPAALVRRFKNKKQLILETDRYALRQTDDEVQQAIARAVSPIEAIVAMFAAELGFASTIARYANGQDILLMDFRDSDLYANYRISFERRHEQVIALLEKAQETGELKAIDNLDELARHLEMIQHGAGHVWAMSQEASVAEYIAHHVDMALRPYRQR